MLALAGRSCTAARMMVARSHAMGLAMRSLFIAAESTPNPDSLKFVPSGRRVLEEDQGTGVFFNSLSTAKNSPLVRELLKTPGVTGVFLGRDFISVNKVEDVSWEDLKPHVLGTLMDGLSTSKPVLEGQIFHAEDTRVNDDDDETVAMIKELIETRIRPAVQEDGGDIFFVSFDHLTGIVRLRMAGSCVGCPSSAATLRGGVENMLRHYIPDVQGIEQVATDEDTKATTVLAAPEPTQTLEQKLAAAGVPGYATRA